ncbi:DUF6691 family protein [Anaeromyxobacter oryzae]|uniref:Transporter n=1 Tax=Anaeromyxobacter oryzae TaxID=2918170 RepID=A0ABM7WP08_9BACT|nr:DUF6691 family protein [Anaeromyxobacter oryzae]BDG01196.1 transporter [Anaeromyxobacter oryzae]
MIRRHAVHLKLGVVGLALGAVLSGAGFSDFGQLHRMFTFTDVRLLLAFGGAVVLAAIGFRIHCRNAGMPRRPLRRGTVPGALLFGIGWAISGGCPGAILAQLGEGKAIALLTLGGILVGAAIGNRLKALLRWDSGSCAS